MLLRRRGKKEESQSSPITVEPQVSCTKRVSEQSRWVLFPHAFFLGKKSAYSLFYWRKVCAEIDCSLMFQQPKIGFLQMAQ